MIYKTILQLVALKDKDTIQQNIGVIYWFRCSRLDCDEEYTGESSRTFVERYKEHLKASSPTFKHQSNTGHNKILEDSSIVGREGQNFARSLN